MKVVVTYAEAIKEYECEEILEGLGVNNLLLSTNRNHNILINLDNTITVDIYYGSEEE